MSSNIATRTATTMNLVALEAAIFALQINSKEEDSYCLRKQNLERRLQCGAMGSEHMHRTRSAYGNILTGKKTIDAGQVYPT